MQNERARRPGHCAELGSAIKLVMATPELLGYILDFCSRRDLRSACMVSVLWDAVVGAFTHFSTLVIFDPESPGGLTRLSRDMNRGGRRGVLVLIPSVDDPHSAEVLKVVGRHSTRIAGLAIGQLSVTSLQHVWRAIQSGAPCLRELVLHSHMLADDTEHAPQSFTLGALTLAAPQLRRLVCSGITLRGPYEMAHRLESIEWLLDSQIGHEIALCLWLAPWERGTSVTGLAVREHGESGHRATWMATAWAGHVTPHALGEKELTCSDDRTTLGRDSTRCRRLLMDESLRRVAFSDALTVVSIPLYFWGLVRAELGDVHLPRLEVLHILLVELGDDGPGEGRLLTPNLRHVVLQVEQVNDVDEEEWPWEQFLTCTCHELEELVTRIVCGTEETAVDLLAEGFELVGPVSDSVKINSRPDVLSFQAWLSWTEGNL